MLKVLIRKQLTEIFRGYFYDQKKNTARSRGATIALFLLFTFAMIVLIGGMFASMSVSLCRPLAEAQTDWLYFAVMGALSVFLGTFGSVFSTYSGLYLAKDNDLLLSMPIPVRLILAARLLTVYLMGLLYSAIVSVPAAVVYWIFVRHDAATVICGAVWILMLSACVMALSGALGWCVARISTKLKNKSMITVLLSLVLMGVYYFFYFRAQKLIQLLILHAADYGARIRTAAVGLYAFGLAGQGNVKALLGCCAVVGALLALLFAVLSRSFLRISASTGAVSFKQYRERDVRQQTLSRALLGRELARFLASPNYMLNCGLSMVMLPLGGIMMLVKGRDVLPVLGNVFAERPGAVPVLLCAAVCMLASMNDMAAPSVSLEGKTLWLVQSMPVTAWQVLRAKLSLQLLLSGVPTLFCVLCLAFITPGGVLNWLSILLVTAAFTCFASLGDLYVGVMKPNLTWTNELAPIKQSIPVVVAIFGGWLYVVAFAGLYLLIGARISPAVYLLLVALLTGGADALLYRRLRTKGAAAFAAL